MDMNPVPADAKRLTPEQLAGGFIDIATGLATAWTTVQASSVLPHTQTANGMGKGTTAYNVEYRCPRCTEEHHITATTTTGDHPVKCHCELTLVFIVHW